MTKDPSEMRPKEFKYKFHYNQEKEILESNKPDIWVEPWKVTREAVNLPILHWSNRKILFQAKAPFEEQEKENQYWIDWEILHVGLSWIDFDPYHFSDSEERRIAVEIIEDCLWQYDGSSNRGNSIVRSVTKSHQLQKLLKAEI